MITVGSLFSGIGGIDLGLERAGMKVIWQCEIDDYASRVLKKHWPDVPNLGDITKVNWDEVERPDLVCGGFPCQDISIAGKGRGLSGERSGLWWEMYKAICVLRPRLVLLENVPMLTHRGLGEVLGALAEGGYDAEWNIVSARYVGANHRRDRIFIIAWDPNRFNDSEERGVQEGKDTITSRIRNNVAHSESAPSGHGHNGNVSIFWHGKEEWERGSAIQSREWWAVEPDVVRVANGVPSRVDRLKCLGNAVVPQVAEFIGEQIIAFDRRREG